MAAVAILCHISAAASPSITAIVLGQATDEKVTLEPTEDTLRTSSEFSEGQIDPMHDDGTSLGGASCELKLSAFSHRSWGQWLRLLFSPLA
jgi:hypothetical protein